MSCANTHVAKGWRAVEEELCVCDTLYLHLNYPPFRCNGNKYLRSAQSIALMLQYPPAQYYAQHRLTIFTLL